MVICLVVQRIVQSLDLHAVGGICTESTVVVWMAYALALLGNVWHNQEQRHQHTHPDNSNPGGVHNSLLRPSPQCSCIFFPVLGESVLCLLW